MQLSFPFQIESNIYNDLNFIVHDGNRNAFDFVTSNYLPQNNIYLLTGASKSGKTYICNIWKKIYSAQFINPKILKLKKEKYLLELSNIIKNDQKYILEDIEKIKFSDENLLYLINTIIEKNSILLITSTKSINNFNFKLKDLDSRFKNIFNIKIQNLNEKTKKQILLKMFTDRQLNVDSEILDYISKKLNNDYSKVIGFVEKFEKKINSENIKKLNMSKIKKMI